MMVSDPINHHNPFGDDSFPSITGSPDTGDALVIVQPITTGGPDKNARLAERLGDILEEQIDLKSDKDVTLHCSGGHTIRVHSSVLYTRSAIYRNSVLGMDPNNVRSHIHVILPDFTHAEVEGFAQLLYTGKLMNKDPQVFKQIKELSNLFEIFSATDIYSVETPECIKDDLSSYIAQNDVDEDDSQEDTEPLAFVDDDLEGNFDDVDADVEVKYNPHPGDEDRAAPDADYDDVDDDYLKNFAPEKKLGWLSSLTMTRSRKVSRQKRKLTQPIRPHKKKQKRGLDSTDALELDQTSDFSPKQETNSELNDVDLFKSTGDSGDIWDTDGQNVLSMVDAVVKEEELYLCPECGVTFRKRRPFLIHISIHRKQEPLKPFRCYKCPKSFPTNQLLKAHQAIHATKTLFNKPRPYVCDACGKSFTTNACLSSHKKNIHVNQEGAAGEGEVSLEDNTRSSIHRPLKRYSSRPNLLLMDDDKFKQEFRMSKKNATRLTELLLPELQATNLRNNPLSPLDQVLVTLNILGSDNFLRASGSAGGFSASSVCRTMGRVLGGIIRLKSTYMRMPPERESAASEAYFASLYRLPELAYAVGVVPAQFEKKPRAFPENLKHEDFKSRRHGYCINCQVVVNESKRILDINLEWPGSNSPSRIWRRTEVKGVLERSVPRYKVAAGPSYPISSVVLTPFSSAEAALDPVKQDFNVRLASMRRETLGVVGELWKARFPALRHLRFEYRRSYDAILGSAILHNMCIEWGDEHFPIPEAGSGDDDLLLVEEPEADAEADHDEEDHNSRLDGLAERWRIFTNMIV